MEKNMAVSLELCKYAHTFLFRSFSSSLFFFLAYLQDYMIGYIIEAHKEIRFSHLCSANKNQKPA